MIRRVLIYGVSLLLSVYILSFLIVFNTTESIQKGVYFKSDSSDLLVGDYVYFCPPKEEPFLMARDRGYIAKDQCSNGMGAMLKKILAAKNDRVKIDENGVYVNGSYIENSRPLKKDNNGELLPELKIDTILSDKQYLLMTDRSKTSFDARYFGITNERDIKNKINIMLKF